MSDGDDEKTARGAMPATLGILLCSGPSLAAYTPAPRAADLVVAVNRAALLQPCHVWACGDWPLIEAIRRQVADFQRPLPRLFTAANSHAWLRDHSPLGEWGRPDGQDVEEMESFYDGHEHELQWTCFTATAALWYCFRRGVTHLDVYGADWGGSTYCDGTGLSDNRRDLKQAGWDLESGIWRRLAGILAGRGMTVTRLFPAPLPPAPLETT